MSSPAEILGSIGSFNATINKDSRLGTVDPTFTGVGLPRIQFDGETALSTKTYQFLGQPPGGGDRVVLTPLNGEYIIIGVLGGGTGLSKDLRFLTTADADCHPFDTANGDPAFTGTQYTVANLALPDPGWPHRIMASGQCYYSCKAASSSGPQTQFDLTCVLDNVTTGPAISRQGMGRPATSTSEVGTHSWAGWALGETVYTGAHTAYMLLVKLAGTGPLTYVGPTTYTAMTVVQVPA